MDGQVLQRQRGVSILAHFVECVVPPFPSERHEFSEAPNMVRTHTGKPKRLCGIAVCRNPALQLQHATCQFRARNTTPECAPRVANSAGSVVVFLFWVECVAHEAEIYDSARRLSLAEIWTWKRNLAKHSNSLPPAVLVGRRDSNLLELANLAAAGRKGVNIM